MKHYKRDEQGFSDVSLTLWDVRIDNVSGVPIHLRVHDTIAHCSIRFHPVGIRGRPSAGPPGGSFNEVNLGSNKEYLASLGLYFTAEELTALEPGEYEFEVMLMAKPIEAQDGGS